MAQKEYSSRFTVILNTNHTASQQETHEIISLLVEPKQELAELDAELVRLRSRVEELANRRQTVGTFVDAHLALVSSFRHLPEDVMTEIFLRCLPTNRNPTRSATEAPLLLARINRRCRVVALNSPRLWSALHIYVPPFDEAHEREAKARLKRRAEGIETWLKRSGTLPLNLSVVMSQYNDQSRASAYRPLINVLASFSSRWGTLVLSVPSSFMRELEKKADLENLASLNALQIDYSKQSIRYDEPGHLNHLSHQLSSADIEFTQVLSKAPEIRSLALQNYKPNVLKLPITWDKLTRLELNSRSSHQTAEDLFVVLGTAASSLESCSVILYCPRSTPGTDNESSHPHISFPNLHTLKVQVAFAPQFGGQMDYSSDAMELFFSSIIAPSLTNFTFSICPTPAFGFSDHMPFLAMIENSNCKIETFFLAFPVTTTALVECLQMFSSLKDFVLHECLWAITNHYDMQNDMQNGLPPGFPAPICPTGIARINACVVTDSFISALTWSHKNPHPFCPLLRSVTITGAIAVSETTMIRFARSRSPSRIYEDEDRVQDGEEELNQPGCSTSSIVSPLKQLIVHYDRETKRGKVKRSGEVCDTQIFPQIQRLRSEEGMKVKMTYPSPHVHHDSPWAGQMAGHGATFSTYSLGFPNVSMGEFDNGLGLIADEFDEDDDLVGDIVGGGPFPLNLDGLLGGVPINLQNITEAVSYIYPMDG